MSPLLCGYIGETYGWRYGLRAGHHRHVDRPGGVRRCPGWLARITIALGCVGRRCRFALVSPRRGDCRRPPACSWPQRWWLRRRLPAWRLVAAACPPTPGLRPIPSDCASCSGRLHSRRVGRVFGRAGVGPVFHVVGLGRRDARRSDHRPWSSIAESTIKQHGSQRRASRFGLPRCVLEADQHAGGHYPGDRQLCWPSDTCSSRPFAWTRWPAIACTWSSS